MPTLTAYRVAQNPTDRLFYVVGPVGGGKWMPVSDGFHTRREAHQRIPKIRGAEKASRAELHV